MDMDIGRARRMCSVADPFVSTAVSFITSWDCCGPSFVYGARSLTRSSPLYSTNTPLPYCEFSSEAIESPSPTVLMMKRQHGKHFRRSFRCPQKPKRTNISNSNTYGMFRKSRYSMLLIVASKETNLIFFLFRLIYLSVSPCFLLQHLYFKTNLPI